MKKIMSCIAVSVLVVLFSATGCEKREGTKEGDLSHTPDSSPTTTSPMNPK